MATTFLSNDLFLRQQQKEHAETCMRKGDCMKTVKEVERYLKTLSTYDPMVDELAQDGRVGVQKAVERWRKQYAQQQEKIDVHKNKLAFDDTHRPYRHAYVAGVDEAGRGPLAGPVVTAAVILPEDCEALVGVDDSKAITKEKREQFAKLIKEQAIAYEIHIQSAAAIDEYNIYEATRQSMEQVVQQLLPQPHVVITDAMDISIEQAYVSLPKADAKSLAVGAASILAKTARDQYMDRLHEKYPMYGFRQHAGYGTKVHLEALQQYGPCEEHRQSFEPVKQARKK